MGFVVLFFVLSSKSAEKSLIRVMCSCVYGARASVRVRAFFAMAFKFILWASMDGIYIVYRTKVIFAQEPI